MSIAVHKKGFAIRGLYAFRNDSSKMMVHNFFKGHLNFLVYGYVSSGENGSVVGSAAAAISG